MQIFDIQAQYSLTHLNPQGQYLIIFIDTGYQFIDVLELTFFTSA